MAPDFISIVYNHKLYDQELLQNRIAQPLEE
ncbi:hypothetical protein QE417_001838 [Mucilaginibacter terrae]|uniref:Uncharacterized protein n=1 Tax=Mucilaginibacter terrae TaxID=1955052 RepID=A0ABU3GSL8_9SPHI|nr:hypothetical protein [Mucilaginibacter terrae]